MDFSMVVGLGVGAVNVPKKFQYFDDSSSNDVQIGLPAALHKIQLRALPYGAMKSHAFHADFVFFLATRQNNWSSA